MPCAALQTVNRLSLHSRALHSPPHIRSARSNATTHHTADHSQILDPGNLILHTAEDSFAFSKFLLSGDQVANPTLLISIVFLDQDAEEQDCSFWTVCTYPAARSHLPETPMLTPLIPTPPQTPESFTNSRTSHCLSACVTPKRRQGSRFSKTWRPTRILVLKADHRPQTMEAGSSVVCCNGREVGRVGNKVWKRKLLNAARTRTF